MEWQRGSRACPDLSGEDNKADDNMSLKPWMRSRLKYLSLLIHSLTEYRCDEDKVGSKHSAPEVTEEAFVDALLHTNVHRER